MRTIIANSSQTIAGLSKQVASLSKQIIQLQRATKNTIPKIDSTAPKDKPATKGELEAMERKLRALLHGQNTGDTEDFKEWTRKEIQYAQAPVDNLARKLKITNDLIDSEKDKRIEAQRIQLQAKDRIRVLEGKMPVGEGQEIAQLHIKERLRALEGAQSDGPEITDDTIRSIMMKLSPEIDVMIAQAVDKIMDARPRAPAAAQRGLNFQGEETQLQLGYQPTASPQHNKRVKTEDGRQGGRTRNGTSADRGSRSGGGPGNSSSTGSRAGTGKGGSSKGGSRSLNTQQSTSLQLLDEEEEKLFMQEPKPMPVQRWPHVQVQYKNVEHALKWAGLVESQGLTSDAEFTYSTIRSGAFSASSLERMIHKRIRSQEGGMPVNHTKVNEAVTKLAKYLELLEKRNHCPTRNGTGPNRN